MKRYLVTSSAVFLLIGCCVATKTSLVSPPENSRNVPIFFPDASVPGNTVTVVTVTPPENESVEPSSCPTDMVEVKGDYCPQVEQTCLEYDEKVVNVNGKVRCLHFAPSKCLSKTKKPMHFCIDRFEWPNKEGDIPEVMVTWNDMKRNCESQGKRLCRDVEWEFACEGPEMLPYPYGYDRNPGVCNIDNPWREFDPYKLGSSNPKVRQAEVERLSQRVPSGSKPQCQSPFGVFDMTGNVDESVINSTGNPYKSGEKGGHWAMGARNRCRPMTTVHNEDFAFYEIGGRCCKDSNE